jgi:hypothetical protein
MKQLLTIIAFLLLTISIQAQSVRLPSGDSITYDFSGATRKGSPGLYKYFTTNTADNGTMSRGFLADFNKDSIAPTRNGLGIRGMINFQREYVLDSIKFYDRSGSRDTIWIYTFDKNNAPKWDTLCYPYKYTPDYIITTCGTCSGLPVITKINANANDTLQFAFFVMRVTRIFLFGQWLSFTPNVSNISFYGRATGRQDTTYNLAHWAFTPWSAKPIDSIVGNFDLANQQDTGWSAVQLAYYGWMRTFDQMYYDNQAVPHGSQSIDLGGGGYTGYKYNAAMARQGHYQFAAVFNDNAYFVSQLAAAGHSVQKSWGTNTITDDPQQPASYSRKGYYMHAQALIGGGCTTCPSVRTYNGTLVKGQGYLKGMGSNNEPTLFAFANAYKNGIEVAAETIGVVDSVALGDPAMPLFMGGFEAYNYDDAKAGIMALKLYYRSRNIRVHGVAFHGIHTLKTDSFPYIPTTDQQIGNHGVSVGYWDDWRKNIHYVQGMRRETGNPNFLVQLDEDTYQKGVYKRKPTNAGETFTVSQLATPRFVVAGALQDAYNSHGTGAGQAEFIATASPLYKHYWYQVIDDQLFTENPNYDGIDQNNGKFDRPLDYTDVPQPWPAHFVTISRKIRLGRYQFKDSTHIVPRGLHVFKYRHATADSTMYEFAVLDSTGTASYTIIGLPNGPAYLITPSYSSRQATQTLVTITGNSYAINADPLPRALIVYEPDAGGSNLSPDANAGSDQNITLPTSSVLVTGNLSSDPDGTINSYLWEKVSGPAGGNISTPSNSSTSIINLAAGTYVFRLTVTDNEGAIDTDNITITVNPAPVVPANKSIRINKTIKIPY